MLDHRHSAGDIAAIVAGTTQTRWIAATAIPNGSPPSKLVTIARYVADVDPSIRFLEVASAVMQKPARREGL
jgi:hypothetical protein